MILDIVTYPAASLKEKCVPVTEITDEIRQLAADMLETMYEAPGVGLAAPQVGRNIRMLVMDPAAQDEEKQPRVVINPELTLSEDTVLSRQEGCLSVPLNYRADVQRAERVHLRYMDLDGKIVEENSRPSSSSMRPTIWTAPSSSTASAVCAVPCTTPG